MYNSGDRDDNIREWFLENHSLNIPKEEFIDYVDEIWLCEYNFNCIEGYY